MVQECTFIFHCIKDGKNIFADPDDVKEFSEEAYYFIGGLLAHSKEMALITNPLVNSYKTSCTWL